MKRLFIILLYTSGIIQTQALVINEIMSNPVGDDSGREWVEIYNNSEDTIDISSLTISIKGGNPVVVTPVSGGTTISPNGYAIIGSTVSGATRFLQDYPNYAGPLFRSSISLVNTGATSISMRLHGSVIDTLDPYTAAKEGSTLSKISGSFVTGTPTPGAENQTVSTTETNTASTESGKTENQTTVVQMSPPSADIVLYVTPEKTVVAGAPSHFSVFGMTRGGSAINGLQYEWAFGDGGQGIGSSTMYRYLYPGRYIAHVEAGNGYVYGTARVHVRVVPPDVVIKTLGTGKYGPYIDIANPNTYDLDISNWKLSIDGAVFSFPRNTMIVSGGDTRFPGLTMGFASTTISSSTVIKMLFPNHEEVTRYHVEEKIVAPPSHIVTQQPRTLHSQNVQAKVTGTSSVSKTSTVKTGRVQPVVSSSTKLTIAKENVRDTRIVNFFRGLFKRQD